MKNPGVVGHPQGIPFRIDAPVALTVLLPEVLLGGGGGGVLGIELAHAGTAANIAGHNCHRRLIDQ